MSWIRRLAISRKLPACQYDQDHAHNDEDDAPKDHSQLQGPAGK